MTQFWTDVQWENVNYMFVDMPPGTGDVPLTVFQSLPVAGVVVVTSPQELVGMIVDKAVNMADMMHVPVLGIVENMAYYTCPDCGKQHAIFGENHIEAIAAKHGIPNTAKLPIDPAIAAACDAIIFSGDMCVGENTAFYHLLMTFSAKPGRSLTFSTVPSSSTARPLKTPNT